MWLHERGPLVVGTAAWVHGHQRQPEKALLPVDRKSKFLTGLYQAHLLNNIPCTLAGDKLAGQQVGKVLHWPETRCTTSFTSTNVSQEVLK
jgi:hypothetical protein